MPRKPSTRKLSTRKQTESNSSIFSDLIFKSHGVAAFRCIKRIFGKNKCDLHPSADSYSTLYGEEWQPKNHGVSDYRNIIQKSTSIPVIDYTARYGEDIEDHDDEKKISNAFSETTQSGDWSNTPEDDFDIQENNHFVSEKKNELIDLSECLFCQCKITECCCSSDQFEDSDMENNTFDFDNISPCLYCNNSCNHCCC